MIYKSVLFLLCAAVAAAVKLTAENFDEIVLNKQDSVWLLEFYTPWCGHCKRLNKVLFEEGVADEFTKIGVQLGQIDCTEESGLCKRFDVSGYPTLKWKRFDGDIKPYSLERTRESLIGFAERVVQSTTVSKIAALPQNVESGKVVFVVSSATSQEFEEAFQHLADGNFLLADFFVCTSCDDEDTIYRIEGGEEVSTFTGETAKMADFFSDNRLPLLPALGFDNFAHITRNGRLTAIAVVDFNDPKSANFLEGVRSMARPSSSNLDAHTLSRLSFGALDGVRWNKFVSQFNIQPEQLPRLFVLDALETRYWEDPEIDEIDEIETFLADVVSGKVPSQGGSLLGVPEKVFRMFGGKVPFVAAVCIGLAFIYYMLIHPIISKPPPVKEEEEVDEQKQQQGEEEEQEEHEGKADAEEEEEEEESAEEERKEAVEDEEEEPAAVRARIAAATAPDQ